MNRRWVCGDVWMNIFPFFDRPQLGLKMAMLSDRFDILVDKHFDGTTELTLWNSIIIRKDIGPKPKVFVLIDSTFVAFPLPDHPLPNKIRFRFLQIEYIDHSVIEFLCSNKHIWDKRGTKLELFCANVQLIWGVLASEIWPVFATNIHHLGIDYGDDLDNLRRRTSPTILTDLDHLISIESTYLLPDEIADFDGPNATSAGQALSKWVHTPSKNGQPKRLFCEDLDEEGNIDWVNSFKEAFARATASVSYKILFAVHKTSIEPFELENERTKEKLTLEKVARYDNYLLLKRCPISEKATAIQWENWDDNLNKVKFDLWRGINSIGPLSPPTEE